MPQDEREKHLRFMTRTRPAGLDKDAVEWALAEIERLRALVEAPIFSGPVIEPDSGPDVLGEQKGEE